MCPLVDVKAGRPEILLKAVRTLEPLIREHADEAERNRQLSQCVVAALAEAGLFRMYTPQTLGGVEADPLTFYRVVEEVARVDGSTGWCVFLASGNPFLGAYLSDQAAEEVFGSDPHVVTAGVIFPYGKATVSDGGYYVSGCWPYASGCQHSNWLFCFCNVVEAGQTRLTDSGEPEVRVAFVPTAQVTIVDNWDVSGLVGTGSHDVVLRNVFVPGEYTCKFGLGMAPQGKHYQSPLYRYPFFPACVLPISVVALGIAQGAVDSCIDVAQSKHAAGTAVLLRDRPMFQVRLAEAMTLVRSARAWLYASLQQTWASTLAGGQVSFEARADVLLAAANATRSAASAVDTVYTAAGATANYRRNPLQRALRDIHAVTQHMATAPHQYESAGRMLLGIQPLQPLVLL